MNLSSLNLCLSAIRPHEEKRNYYTGREKEGVGHVGLMQALPQITAMQVDKRCPGYTEQKRTNKEFVFALANK